MQPNRLSPSARALIWLLIGVYLAICLQRAWVAEDAYITFRTVDNFLNGLGLRWNPAERVQSYTHPLWMFVLAGATAIARDPWVAAVAAGLLFSASAVWFGAFRLAATSGHAFFFLASCSLCFGFVDYSTSGLENSLAHLLLLLFAASCFRSAPLWQISLIYALLCLNRMDHGLLCAPLLGVAAWRQVRTRRDAAALAAGFTPFLAWEAFSLFYYGFPFPNTAYAKLSNGIPAYDLARQGVLYLGATAQGDPVAFWTIVAALLVAAWSRDRAIQAIGAGLLLYVFYLVKAGGDFMLGRLTSAPFVLAAAILLRTRLPWSGNVPWLASSFAVLILGCGSGLPTFLEVPPGMNDLIFGTHDVADERSVYWGATAIRFHERSERFPEHGFHWVARGDLYAGRKIVYYTNVGISSWALGPRAHVIDLYALADPLLARLPALIQPWRPGHFLRRVPWGYPETIESGDNRIVNENLRGYWTHLAAATRDPLLSPGRWAEIIGLNLGRWDSLLAPQPPKEIAAHDLREPVVTGWEGLRIGFGGERHARQLEIQVDHDDGYHIRFLRQGRELTAHDISRWGAAPGMRTITLTVPAYARWRGYDAILVVPREGDVRYWVGPVRLLD